MNKFPIRKATRLKEYDYSTAGYYYITICTYMRRGLFGYIENNQMNLNKFGTIANNLWLEMPNHFPNIELFEYIVMPNHIHGIIKINKPVGDGHARTVNNLSVIIGAYKSAVTKQIKHNSFKWQRSFYEHIIRDEKSLNAICEYINNNVLMWINDKENIINQKVTGQACLTPTE